LGIDYINILSLSVIFENISQGDQIQFARLTHQHTNIDPNLTHL